MSFCKFSSEICSNSVTVLDNTFLEQYLPYASGEQVRVYLFGLYLCGNNNVMKTSLYSLENFAQQLGISADDVMDAFTFWQDQGLVQIITTTPPQIQYLPVKGVIPKKKFKPDKYEQFNLQAQAILNQRMITPNEYSEYYTLLEAFNMSQEALLMIMQYCAEYKGANVGYSYILAVAKNWAHEGILSLEQVEETLKEFNEADQNLKQIMKELGSSKKATMEEKQQYLKWTKDLDFSLSVILFVAKKVKKGGFVKLDNRLTKYYELHLMSEREIEEYEKQKDKLYSLAKEINKIIGVYYENLENVVESYINPWLTRGYGDETLKVIASYCFKNSIRNLEGMNSIVQKFFKMGLITTESIAQFVSKAKAEDNEIKGILENAKLVRNVTSWDREFYRIWVYSWNMPLDIIKYAATLSSSKAQPMQYINKILSNWHEQKITTLDEAKLSGDLFKNGVDIDSKTDNSVIHSRKYTSEELQSLICDIDEIEI